MVRGNAQWREHYGRMDCFLSIKSPNGHRETSFDVTSVKSGIKSRATDTGRGKRDGYSLRWQTQGGDIGGREDRDIYSWSFGTSLKVWPSLFSWLCHLLSQGKKRNQTWSYDINEIFLYWKMKQMHLFHRHSSDVVSRFEAQEIVWKVRFLQLT